MLGPLDLDLEAVVRHPMWVLGIKFRLSGRAAKAAKPPLHPFPLFM